MDRDEAGAYVKSLTTSRSVLQAVKYVGEGRTLRGTPSPALLMAALLTLEADPDPGIAAAARETLAAYSRTAVRSEFDTAAELLKIEYVPAVPTGLRGALAEVGRHTTSLTLRDITPAAVSAAQQVNPGVIDALTVLAGLTPKELRARTERLTPPVALPGVDTRVAWSSAQVRAAFEVIDGIVRGTTPATTAAATPMRPVELLLQGGANPWATITDWLENGVPYEFLLTQRLVGSSWGAHRNSTSGKLQDVIIRTLADLLEERGIVHKVHGGSRDDDDPRLGQVRLTVDGGRIGVVVSVANDSGTAKKSGAAMLNLPAEASMPLSLVLVGKGWAERKDTVALARAFGGRVYSEQTLTDLATDLEAAVGVGPSDDTRTNHDTTDQEQHQ